MLLSEPQRPQRHFPPVNGHADREPGAARGARGSIALGGDLWCSARTLLIGGATIFAGVLLVDFAVAQYQELQVREHGARLANLAEFALASVQAEVASVSDLGEGRYELAVSLSDVSGEQPIYVMSPDMRAYVQVGKIWHEVPLTPIDDGIGNVSKVEGKHTYRYVFEAWVSNFRQLSPNHMHVRFADTM
jgi:putative ABC transport system ATP-binding protein/macrolide transport system ATP-binding/permease protein/lipoprotein-releasing system ATP-binding protein